MRTTFRRTYSGLHSKNKKITPKIKKGVSKNKKGCYQKIKKGVYTKMREKIYFHLLPAIHPA